MHETLACPGLRSNINGPSAIGDTGVLSLGATRVRSNRLSLATKYTLEAGSASTSNTGNLQALGLLNA